MKILIIAPEDNATARMAVGWLRWFDAQLTVSSAGVFGAGKQDARAIAAMQAAGVDIANETGNTVGQFLAENWDFVISVAGDALFADVKFTGWVGGKIGMELPDPAAQTGPVEEIDAEYRTICHEIRNRMFDFYLQHTLGRDILGADSCGAECDL